MTHPTTHWPCPADGTPCRRERAEGCPHVNDGVRACVDPLGDMPEELRTMSFEQLLAESVTPDEETMRLADELVREAKR